MPPRAACGNWTWCRPGSAISASIALPATTAAGCSPPYGTNAAASGAGAGWGSRRASTTHSQCNGTRAIALTSTDPSRTVPAALAFFTGASQYQSPVTAIAAASVVVPIPVVVLVLLFQRRIVAGLTGGTVKG